MCVISFIFLQFFFFFCLFSAFVANKRVYLMFYVAPVTTFRFEQNFKIVMQCDAFQVSVDGAVL
jgi:hypothetical protein